MLGLTMVFMKPAGMWMKGFQSVGPASRTQTVCWPPALNRSATMQPAEPAPMMM